jgi:hypothetical protein
MGDSGRRRPRYFEGRFLSSADLALEQEYLDTRAYRQNRLLGWGIVEGLTVDVGVGVGVGTITVSPGYAVDAAGHEVVLSEPVSLDAGTMLPRAGATGVVTATWDRVPDGPVPSDDPTAPQQFLYWLERPRIGIEAPSKVTPPSLVLATVKRLKRRGFTIDVTSRDNYRKQRFPRR